MAVASAADRFGLWRAGMKQWKQALIAGSAGASLALFLQRRRSAGILFAGVSLVTLASEHTEKFKALYEKFPDYLERGNRILETASRIGEQVSHLGERRLG
jgi:hypothetical protein